MEPLLAFFSHPVVAVILLLGILIFVHEAGHFIVGKLSGIAVEIFSVGFGPVLIGFKRKETQYRLCLIPFGGYVKFYGSHHHEDVPEEIKGRELLKASVSKRVLVTAFGPIANFLLAIIVYAGMGMYGIPHPPPVVGEVLEGSPAALANFQFQDKVLNINGKDVRTWKDLQKTISNSPGVPLSFLVERGDKEVQIEVVPNKVKNTDIFGQDFRGQLGVSPLHLASQVTILNSKKEAFKAGLANGDKVVAIYLDDNKKIKIDFWRQLIGKLQLAYSQNLSQVRLEVISEQSQNEGSKSSLTREVVLKLPSYEGMTPTKKQVEDLFGFSDSQLTISKINKKQYQDLISMDAEKAALISKRGKLPFDVLKSGDQIVKWNGKSVKNIFQYSDLMSSYYKPLVELGVLRGSEVKVFDIALKPIEVQRAEGKVTQYILPVEFMGKMVPPPSVYEKYGFFQSIWYGTKQTASQSLMIVKAIIGLFTGDVPLKALGGPISIGKIASDSVKLGFMTFFSALALISVNLGVINLFPIPVLDGGQLILWLAEAVYRKPLPEAAIENFQKIGFILVLALVVMATYNDLSRFWSSMLKGMVGLFQ